MGWRLKYRASQSFHLYIASGVRRTCQPYHHIYNNDHRAYRIQSWDFVYDSTNCGGSFSWRVDPGEFWARFDFTVYKLSFPTSYQLLTLARYDGGGCFHRSAVIPPGRAYLIES